MECIIKAENSEETGREDQITKGHQLRPNLGRYGSRYPSSRNEGLDFSVLGTGAYSHYFQSSVTVTSDGC